MVPRMTTFHKHSLHSAISVFNKSLYNAGVWRIDRFCTFQCFFHNVCYVQQNINFMLPSSSHCANQYIKQAQQKAITKQTEKLQEAFLSNVMRRCKYQFVHQCINQKSQNRKRKKKKNPSKVNRDTQQIVKIERKRNSE